MRKLAVGERIILTLWVGAMWAIGYLAVPVLFAQLDDRKLAGALAGEMFTSVYIIGLACCVLLIVAQWFREGAAAWRGWRIWGLVGAFLLLAVAFFGIQPMMQDLKLQGLAEGSAQAAQFGKLHGVSSVLYLITSLLGLALVAFGNTSRDDSRHRALV